MKVITRSGWLPVPRHMSKHHEGHEEREVHEEIVLYKKPVVIFVLFAIFVVMLAAPNVVCAQPSFPTAIPQTKFDSGQDIQPYFEGWIKNADGTFDMVFGYFNRNWKEEPIVPAGAQNSVEPGGPDKGQPTFFLPRRQGWVYRVRVPANFAKQQVVWTITAHGKTNTAYGTLDPVEEITERIIQTRGNLNPGEDDPNKPPVIAVAPVTNAAIGSPVTLTANVTDDGLPKPRVVAPKPAVVAQGFSPAVDAAKIQAQSNSNAPQRPRGLNVTWMQLRGPAKVTFDKSTAIAVTDGKAVASATFPKPGTYVLRATANDGALATKTDVTVTVANGRDVASGSASNVASGFSRTSASPIIDNARVTVWDLTVADPNMPKPSHDSVWVSVSDPGKMQYVKTGARPDLAALGGRAIAIDVKDARVTPLENKTGYPLAFPRPGQLKKLFENDRVIVWDFSWTPGVPTPMHFHDKDVVVTYVADGALKSTTTDGQSTTNEFSVGTVRFNERNRVHTEVLAKGTGRAIITELK